MEEVRTQVFRLRDGVAIELPEALGFAPGTEVVVSREGDVVTIKPKLRMTPREFVEALERLPKPKKAIGREPIEFPERLGL